MNMNDLLKAEVDGKIRDLINEQGNKRLNNDYFDGEFDKIHRRLESIKKYMSLIVKKFASHSKEIFPEGERDIYIYSNGFITIGEWFGNLSEEYKALEKECLQGKKWSDEFLLKMDNLYKEARISFENLVDEYGFEYEYIGDGTKDKKGSVVLKPSKISENAEIRYKGINYSIGQKDFSILVDIRPTDGSYYIIYNSAEKKIQVLPGVFEYKPILSISAELSDDNFFIDEVISVLDNYVNDKRNQYDRNLKLVGNLKNALSNLELFSQMLSNEFGIYKLAQDKKALIKENNELKGKNEELVPLIGQLEDSKKYSDNLADDMDKKEKELTKTTEEKKDLETKVNSLGNEVASLKKNQSFLMESLKHLVDTLDKIANKKIVLTGDIKNLQGEANAINTSSEFHNMIYNGEENLPEKRM